MKRITVALTGDSGEKLEQLLAQTGMNTNRLMNTLISNAVVSDVVKSDREPVSAVAASVDFERVSAMLAQLTPAELTEFARQFVRVDAPQVDRLLDALIDSFEMAPRGNR